MARIPATRVPREVKARTGGAGPNYRQVYALILDGELPAHQVNGRWFVEDDDLPAFETRWQQKIAARSARRVAA
jgi:hypothetical protein